MDRILVDLTSPAMPVALLAAVSWAPAAGFPTWPAVSRGRFAVTAAVSGAIAGITFFLVRRLYALGGA